MFSFLRRRTTSGNDLLQSRLYDEKSFYGAFLRDVARAQKSVIIESPFLTERRAREFLTACKKPKKRGVAMRVNTRNPRHHDTLLEIQSWKAMRLLRDNGVKVYTFNDMRHRKLAIIDGHILWEGSLNILSQAHSKEIMRRTDSAVICQQMEAFTRIHNRCWWYNQG